MESSRSAKLPAELRLNIYGFALFVPRGIEFGFFKASASRDQREDSTLSVRPTKPHHLSPNLLGTCKQIYREALPILLSNKFSVPLNWAFLVDHIKTAAPAGRALAAWGARYGPHGDMIKDIHISYSSFGIENLTGIATFAKHSLCTLDRVGIRPSLILSIDLMHCAIGYNSLHVIRIDLGRGSAAEDRQIIQHVARKAAVNAPWRINMLGRHVFKDRIVEAIRREADYVEGIVAYVQEGGVWEEDKKAWAAEKKEYSHTYEVEEGQSEGEGDEYDHEKRLPKGGRGRGSRGSKKNKGSKGKGKKW